MIHVRRRFAPRFLDRGRSSNIAYGIIVLVFTVFLTASYIRLVYEAAAFTIADTKHGFVKLTVTGTYTASRSSRKIGIVAVVNEKGREIKFPSSSVPLFNFMNDVD
jgi:hypothetical protein